VVGCLAVLGVTFALGVAAARHWPDGLPGFRGVRSAATAAPTATAQNEKERRPEARGFDKDRGKTPAEAPVLTFYHELTAPLPSPPPLPARPGAKSEAKPVEAKVGPRPAEASRPALAAPPLAEAAFRARTAPSALEPRFTVQVGAFKARSQAEALRARLAQGGQEVSVSEFESGGITQYRVRVGSFATREAAREAATRLADERQVATYVTTR
jgi:cell division protein FtsN